MTNEVRFNYSRSRSTVSLTLEDFGAVPPTGSELYPSVAPPQNSAFEFLGDLIPMDFVSSRARRVITCSNKINVIDNASRIVGTHQLKFGVDYRRLRPETKFVPYEDEYIFGHLPTACGGNTTPRTPQQ